MNRGGNRVCYAETFKCRQDVLGYLSKVQGLHENRESFKAPRRDYTSGDANRRPQLGSRQDDRPRDRRNNVNVRFVRRQIDRRNSNFNTRRNRDSEERELYGRRCTDPGFENRRSH